MNSKEALKTIGMTKTNNIKSESLNKPRVMYLVKELRKKELQTIKQDLDQLEKLKKVIKFLKLNYIYISISPDGKLIISDCSECMQTSTTYLPENTTIDKMFKILKEVLEDE